MHVLREQSVMLLIWQSFKFLYFIRNCIIFHIIDVKNTVVSVCLGDPPPDWLDTSRILHYLMDNVCMHGFVVRFGVYQLQLKEDISIYITGPRPEED